MTIPERVDATARRISPARVGLAGVAALLGAAVAVAVLLLAGWRLVPVLRYEVRVFFEAEATPEHWDAVRTEMESLPHDEDVRVRSAEETYAEVARLYAEDGDTPPDPTSASRSLVLVTSGRSFDCEPFAGLKKNAGVRTVVIAEFLDGGPTAAFDC